MKLLKLKWPILGFWQTYFGGHITIGSVTIFGANAMNWTVNISTKKWGYICFTLPVLARFSRDRYNKKLIYQWYFYISPNATPWACTFYRGSNKNERIRAMIRKMNFGHGFRRRAGDTEGNLKLTVLNNKFDSFHIHDYEVNEYLESRK
jgi:hypothetical protein